jgi:tetratricopeptide (TPR) repeat protein
MKYVLPVAALLLLAPLLALAQSSPERLAQAQAARQAGNHPEAIRIYRTLVEDPDPSVRALALEGAALLLSWQGEYSESVKYYREVARISPEKRRDAIYGAARTLGWGRKHNDALEELEPLIKENPDDVEVRMLEGQIAGWGGFTDRSVDALEHVLKLEPTHKEAHLTLGKVLSWGSRLAESENAFEDLLEKHPDYNPALIGMTYTVMWQGRPHTAKKYFDRITDPAFQAEREYRIARSALQWGLGDRADALRERKQLMRDFPGEPDVRDLWRAQSGIVGHNLKGDAQILRDNFGLEIWSLGAGGAYDLSNPVFVFAEGRKEWLRQDGREGGFPQDDVEVLGGRGGLDFNYEKWSLRGSLGARHSDVDTGGTTGGLSTNFMIRPNLGFNLGVDTDFAFFTPQAVRNDVRMTAINLTTWSQVSSRLGLNFNYARTHYEGPDGEVHFTSPAEGERLRFDQNRDWFAGAARFQAGGFGTSHGNVRLDLGLRGLYFRFDRQFPEVGYWNPRRFRQVMASVTPTYRRGEEFAFIAHAAGGVQSQDDANWEPAFYLYGEFLYQLGRRWDLWSRADYTTSDVRQRTVGDGYRSWSLAGGFMVRLGERQPDPKPKGERIDIPEPIPPERIRR